MSKVPNGLRDANSAAFNKGKTYCSRTRKGLAEAYFDQFKRDMSDFLNARAEEVVEGGLMVITVPCVPDDALPSHTGAAMLQEVLGSCLIDMANMVSMNLLVVIHGSTYQVNVVNQLMWQICIS